MTTTTKLEDFGQRELNMLGELLNAYKTSKDKTEFFDDDGVHGMMNFNSGNVFLTNSDYQVAMMNDDKLEDFISCPNCGHEDFLSEFIESSSEKCCKEYYKELDKSYALSGKIKEERELE